MLNHDGNKKTVAYLCSLRMWKIVGDLVWVVDEKTNKKYLEDECGTRYYRTGFITKDGSTKSYWSGKEFDQLKARFDKELSK